MFTVIDNFLPYEEYALLRHIMLGEDFPWYLNLYVNENTYDLSGDLNDYQFTHTAFVDGMINSNELWAGALKPLINKINAEKWIRIKCNLTTKTEVAHQHGLHNDFEMPGLVTGIFYINSNNGQTVFEDGRTCDAVANRLVLFDATLKHTGTTCTDAKIRVVINLNFFPKPEK